jgi:hypothetical protein
MGPPTETMSLPVVTGAVEVSDDTAAVDWRDLV